MSSPPQQSYVPTQFRVSDFLTWQRASQLDLNPPFQRRSVWKPGARSFLVDTVVRGLPIPLVFLRERLDLVSGESVREVVDGQQRLRTILGFVDPTCLPDYKPKDHFTVLDIHNEDIADKNFDELSATVRRRILTYRFSVQILPESLSDANVLDIFARLNSTGQRLSFQELRNAAYFGVCKTLMYELAFEQTKRWIDWQVLTGDQVARMAEVELTSDLVYNIIHGLSGKSQPRLDKMYKEFDKHFPGRDLIQTRFREVMATIDEYLGRSIAGTVYRAEVHFFTLFAFTYDLMYGLGSELIDRQPAALPDNYRAAAVEASRRFKELEVPRDVLDAVARASADYGRRETRLTYMHEIVGQRP